MVGHYLIKSVWYLLYPVDTPHYWIRIAFAQHQGLLLRFAGDGVLISFEISYEIVEEVWDTTVEAESDMLDIIQNRYLVTALLDELG